MEDPKEIVRQLREAELDWALCGDMENADLARQAFECIEALLTPTREDQSHD